MMTTWNGVSIYANPLATALRHRVERLPIKKRRKGWRVVVRQEPAAYRLANGSIVAHPDLVDQLRSRIL